MRDVKYVVDNGKQLLDNISLTARPGTLTAVIGGSGAGKSTLARLIAGYTTPSSGSVTFAGHNIHANTHRCAAGSGWSRRTTSCTGS